MNTKLRDMVGVNVHMSYNNTVYNSAATVQAKLTELGVTQVRDFYVPNRSDQWAKLAGLSTGVCLGIGSDWIGTAQAAIAAAKTNVPNLVALEGLNEYDLSGDPAWRTVARDHNDALRRAVVKDVDLLGRVPVIAPSLVWDGDVNTATDDYLLNADRGNRHPYPGGQWTTLAASASALTTTRKLTGALPCWATEWGYHTATGGYIAPGHPAVTETQQRDRMIAGLLTMQGAGWERVFLYELLDLFSADGMENRFGLYRNDGTAKPAATALKMWLGWVGDLDEAAVPFAFGQPAGVKMRVFERSATEQLVAFWREADAPAANLQINMADNLYHWTFGNYRASNGGAAQGWAVNARAYLVPSVGTEPVVLLIRKQP